MGFFIIYHTVRVVTLVVYHICPKLLIPYLVAPSYWAANPTRACRREVVGARILLLRRQLFLKRSHLFLFFSHLFLKQGELFLGGRVSVGIGSPFRFFSFDGGVFRLLSVSGCFFSRRTRPAPRTWSASAFGSSSSVCILSGFSAFPSTQSGRSARGSAATSICLTLKNAVNLAPPRFGP